MAGGRLNCSSAQLQVARTSKIARAYGRRYFSVEEGGGQGSVLRSRKSFCGGDRLFEQGAAAVFVGKFHGVGFFDVCAKKLTPFLGRTVDFGLCMPVTVLDAWGVTRLLGLAPEYGLCP